MTQQGQAEVGMTQQVVRQEHLMGKYSWSAPYNSLRGQSMAERNLLVPDNNCLELNS